MKYTISKRHVFVAKEPVKMYFVNDMPFAFDALENHQKQDKWILTECAINPEYELEDILRWGDYLMEDCLLYTSPSPRDRIRSRMPSSA